MNVMIRYFAAAADAAGCEEEELTVDAGATLGVLKSVLEQRYGPEMAKVVNAGSFLIDKVVRRDPDFPLSARVDVLPPFAGG
jgi:sulfur-carrier protein